MNDNPSDSSWSRFKQINVSQKYVSDGMKPFFSNWTTGQPNGLPVLISAPTGSGKNTFILNNLIPYAESLGRRVLILSNRIALNKQQKELIARRFYPDTQKFSDSLCDKEDFGLVTIWSYQSAWRHINSVPQNIYYVVFDEAHYFLADAPFNAYTELQLNGIIRYFSSTVHIFMTATPEAVMQHIINAEYWCNAYVHNYFKPLEYKLQPYTYPDPATVLTVFQINKQYDSYDLFFFQNEESIKNLIKNTPNEKWLIFTASKDKGEKFAAELGTSVADYLDASHTDMDKTWLSVIKGKLPKQVLVATTVIDNGVSIFEDALKNIVVPFCDSVLLLQIIGRKRRSGDERVKIYLDWGNLDNYIQSLFYADDFGVLHPNRLAYFQFDFLLNFYVDIRQKIEQDRKNEPKNRFESENKVYSSMVLNWLQKDPTKATFIDIEDNQKALNALVELIEKYVGKSIEPNDQTLFFNKFISLAMRIPISVKRPRTDEGREHAAINNYFSILNLPYESRISGGTWIISRKAKVD